MKVSGIRLELTDACNLRCKHCLRKHAYRPHHISIDSIHKLITQAAPYGITEVGLTGGEPTLHPKFEEILKVFSGAGYAFTLFTNASDFCRTYKIISRFRKNLREIRLSLDGAQESTHDKNRGRGSYKLVMEAAKFCRDKHLPFSLNMVISQLNKDELFSLVRLANELKSRAVFFAHLQLTRRPLRYGLALSPSQRLRAETTIRTLQKRFGRVIKIFLCSGSYVKNPILLCPQPLGSFHVDCKGDIVFCSLLSSLDSRLTGTQLVGNLRDTSLAEGRKELLKRYALFARARLRELFRRRFKLSDHFSCDWCLKYFEKAHA